MNSQITSPTTIQIRKVYRQRWYKAIVLIMSAAILVVLLWPFVLGEGMTYRWLLPMTLCLLFAGISLYAALYNRAIILDGGIEFYRFGYRILTTWDNIERIADAQMGRRRGEVLMLRQSALQVNKWLAWSTTIEQRLEREGQFIPLERTIPLFTLLSDWRNSELGQDIKRHAPRLFEEDKK